MSTGKSSIGIVAIYTVHDTTEVAHTFVRGIISHTGDTIIICGALSTVGYVTGHACTSVK